MSYFRSYFEKNNTILKNSYVNTAKNPTTEIFYGSGFSKFLFRVDLSTLRDKVQNGELVVDSNTRHYLNMTNTIFGDEGFKGQSRSSGRERTTSFNLIIFNIPEFWDEGIGFDYGDVGYDYTSGNHTYDERPSNWYNKSLQDTWTTEGVYNNSPEIITTAHFDNGNENLHVDITDFVNGVILNGDTNNGLGIAFPVDYQDLNPATDQSVAFFTKYTQTFYEPFIESIFEDRIIDNRQDFVEKMNQNLYLYVTKGGNPYNLDELPTVDILNSSSTLIDGLGNLETTLVRQGVYKVTFAIDGVTCDGKRFFYDNWKGLILDGVEISDVKQKFIPKPYTSLYTIGENQTELHRYSIQFFGIAQSEKIKSGEKRKVVVTFRSIDIPKSVLLDEIYYRIYVKEGRTQVNVFDWTLLDKTNENSFILDTTIMVPREYILELKGKTHGEEIFYEEHIKFEIVSEK